MDTCEACAGILGIKTGQKNNIFGDFFSGYFKCSVEWRGENLTLTQHSLAVVNHESGFEIFRSKVKLVFSLLNTGEKHKFELTPAN